MDWHPRLPDEASARTTRTDRDSAAACVRRLAGDNAELVLAMLDLTEEAA